MSDNFLNEMEFVAWFGIDDVAEESSRKLWNNLTHLVFINEI